VSNVLSQRTIEAGECRIELAPLSVRGMVASVLGVCRMSLAHRADVSIRWAGEADGGLPALVLGDAGRLSQVLLNLLTSAHAGRTRAHTCASLRAAR
jgi:signal transduction histidine kinase